VKDALLKCFLFLTKTILQNTISRCEMPQPNLASIQPIRFMPLKFWVDYKLLYMQL